MKSYQINSVETESGEPEISARMCLPPVSMSSLIFAGVERDTRRLTLNADQRRNHFPSSPLCSVLWVLEGECHLIEEEDGDIKTSTVLPNLSFLGPNDRPFSSWSPGTLRSVTIGFYPDGWTQLTGQSVEAYVNKAIAIEEILKGEILSIFRNIINAGTLSEMVDALTVSLEGHWQDKRRISTTHILSDWINAVGARAALSNSGQSLRQFQRRIRHMTGQSKRALLKTSRMEVLHNEVMQRQAAAPISLTNLANDLGYSDQSHMGREFRDVTGVSPKKLGALIETDESYWCYKLLGQRFVE